MANELTVSFGCQYYDSTSGIRIPSIQQLSKQFNQTTKKSWASTVVIGTSEEDIAPTDLTDPGFYVCINLSTSNYVQIGPKSGGAMVAVHRLRASNGMCFGELEPSATLRAIANTAACNVLIVVWDR